ncbi:MAG: sigma-54-dependent transcriptional regulator [Gemmatimonas sp.]
MPGGVVLIVEDEAPLARNMKAYLERQNYEIGLAHTAADGLRLYRELRPDAVIVDHNLPDGTGLELIQKIRTEDRTTKLVMATAHGTVDVAVSAMKSGADDYLTKPISLDALSLLVGKLLAQSRTESSLAYYRAREAQQGGIDCIVGESPAMKTLKEQIARVQAATPPATRGTAPPPAVLILGETGTGKELIARALHYGSARRGQPFIEVNCAALPAQLIESELFGHERGAFTDARDRKVGLFQAADSGTFFLDEIGEMPLALQAKLLKVIEDGVIRPVGSLRDRSVNVRLIAATNALLEDRVRDGEFRSDLLYRLNTLTIVAPPLRKRGDDIMLLAERFLREFAQRYGRQGLGFAAAARSALLGHSWPGNVRELRNAVERAVLMSIGTTITADDLDLREPAVVRAEAVASHGAGATLADVERDVILAALRKTAGNVTRAARELGISRDTLRYRMEKFALKRDDFS